MVGLVVDIVVVVNESADWGEEGEINISPDNIADGGGRGGPGTPNFG